MADITESSCKSLMCQISKKSAKNNVQTIKNTYGESDLAKSSLFSGGFINFGYWKDIEVKSNNITSVDRTNASIALYQLLLDKLLIKDNNLVVEIGCGHGYGAILAHGQSANLTVIGLDILDEQINRAIQIHSNYIKCNQNILFKSVPEEKLSIDDECADIIFSVEAAQHFISIDDFLQQAYKALKPYGKLGITTFFSKSTNTLKKLKGILPSVKNDFDRVLVYSEFCQLVESYGFTILTSESIGEFVFDNLNSWALQTQTPVEIIDWNNTWGKAIKSDFLDYCLLVAQKPGHI